MRIKPPPGNVRSVQTFGKNANFIYVNKKQELAQLESFQELIFARWLDKRTDVEGFTTQPEDIEYLNSKGQRASYVPDFLVRLTDGSIELHEVTVAARREAKNYVENRERAARELCEQRGWKYVVWTEYDLPGPTAVANLEHIQPFGVNTYENKKVRKVCDRILTKRERIHFIDLIKVVSEYTNLPIDKVCTSIMYDIWHSRYEIDWDVLLFKLHAKPNKSAYVWLAAQGG